MIRPKNNRFEVIVYSSVANGKERRVSRMAKTKAEAKRLEKHLKEELQSGREPSGATMKQLIDSWLKVARHEPSTRYQVDSRIKNWVTPALGNIPVWKIRTEMLDRLYADWSQKMSPASVRKNHGIIHAALKQAQRWDWISTNPASLAMLPKSPPPDPQPPSTEEVGKLLNTTAIDDPALHLFVRLGAVTGKRRGELVGLRWDDIDFTTQTMRVVRSVSQCKGGPYVKCTKTGARYSISLDSETINELQTWHTFCEGVAAQLGVEYKPSAYVFSDEVDGTKFWNPRTPSAKFQRLRKKAKVGHVKLKDLRHFMVSHMLANGVDIRTIAARVGHARTSTTLNVYSGLVTGSDQNAAELIGNLIR